MQIRCLLIPFGAIVLGLGCTGDRESTAIPSSPASCAGTPRPALRQQRVTNWQRARTGSPTDLWVGLARTLSAEELVKRTRDVSVAGAVVVYPFNHGTYAKVTFAVDHPRDANEFRAASRPFVERALNTPVSEDESVRTTRRGLAKSDVPFGAVRLKGDRGAVNAFVTKNKCLVHSLQDGAVNQMPVLPTEVDPS